MGSVVFEYVCPNECRDSGSLLNLRVNAKESNFNELCMECYGCGVQLVFKRLPGLFKEVTRRERVLFKP